MLVSFTGALAFGTSFNSVWALANQLQLIMLFPFLKLQLTDEFSYFLNDFQFTTFKLDFLPKLDIPYVEKKINTLQYVQTDPILIDSGFESGSYFINFLGVFRSLFFFLIANSIFLILYKILKAKNISKGEKYVKKLFEFFHFSVYIRIALEAYTFSVIISASEVENTDNAEEHTISYIIA